VLSLVDPLLFRGHVAAAAQVASGTHNSFKQQSKFVGHPFIVVSVVPLNAALHVVGVVTVQVAVGVQTPLKQHELSPLHLLLVVVPLVEASQVVRAAQVASGTHNSFKQQSKFVGHPLVAVSVVPLNAALHVVGVVFAQVAVGVQTPLKQQF
jgi:hypothetical protein